jgi:DinB superfamily
MHAQLVELEDEFNSALARLHQLRTSVPASVWGRRPAPERWSPGECVAHLNLTSSAMLPRLRAGLDEARRSGIAAPAHYRRDLIGWLLWKSLKPAGGFKTKTIPTWVPSGERPPDELVAGFEQWHSQQIACVRESDGLPIHAIKITSPVDARARYSVFSALCILARHQHRHLWQAEQASR